EPRRVWAFWAIGSPSVLAQGIPRAARQLVSRSRLMARMGAQVGVVTATRSPFTTGMVAAGAKFAERPKYGATLKSSVWATSLKRKRFLTLKAGRRTESRTAGSPRPRPVFGLALDP